jgi:hypothetical protein
MEENRSTPVGRRAALLLHRLHVNLNRVFYKPTRGAALAVGRESQRRI